MTVHFSLKVPQALTELLNRPRSLVVAYGRLTRSEPQMLKVNFQGREVLSLKQGQKPPTLKELEVALMAIDTNQRATNPSHRLSKLSAKECNTFAKAVLQSDLVDHFTTPVAKRTAPLVIESDQLVRWNQSKFDFEDRYNEAYGKRVTLILEPDTDFEGWVPPEQRNKRGASVTEQTEEETVEQVRKHLNFWLYGPVL